MAAAAGRVRVQLSLWRRLAGTVRRHEADQDYLHPASEYVRRLHALGWP
jgi:hypothetical protein